MGGRRAAEAVALADDGVDDVDLDVGVRRDVGDGPGREDVGEHQVFVVEHGRGALGREIGPAVGADGRDEAQSLLEHDPLHVGRELHTPRLRVRQRRIDTVLHEPVRQRAWCFDGALAPVVHDNRAGREVRETAVAAPEDDADRTDAEDEHRREEDHAYERGTERDRVRVLGHDAQAHESHAERAAGDGPP